MKKLDNFVHDIDVTFDKNVSPTLMSMKKYFPTISTIILVSLMSIFFIKIIVDKPYHLTAIIKSDLTEINKILTNIDKNCNILSFGLDNVPVDFLNIKSFSGSTVGCLNLAYPAKWSGPYMDRNPTLQGKLYEICKTKDGLYILPGHGVKLPNGFICGKNFVINTTTSINELIKEGGPLNYKGEILAIKITFKIGDWDNPLTKVSEDKFEKVNAALKEFNQAFSFTCNSNMREIKA